jgi:hypothetical protein
LTRRALLARAALSAALSTGCKCAREEPLRTDFADPRPAHAVAPRPDAGPIVFRVASESAVEFSLPARDGTPKGTIRSVGGEVTIHPMELVDARGVVRADLTSLVMSDESPDAGGTASASSWLELGRERDDFRFATFEIHRVTETSVRAAHEGTLENGRGAMGDGGNGETRRVELSTVGSLTVHGRRANQTVELVAHFDYPAPALTGVSPARITLETRRPLSFPIATYDLLPRGPDGTVRSADLPLLGRKIGRKVRVTVKLVLEPRG